jgi:creatinine amidohydrolase
MIMQLADMTWKDVQEYLESSDALIVPLGTCEQHGLHLPLSTDTLIAEAFARRISDECGVPLAPTLPYGVNLPCDRFMSGTAGLSFDGLRLALSDLLSDWARQGFRRFFVVTAHGCATDGFGFAHHEAIKDAALSFITERGCSVSILFPYWCQMGDLLTAQTGVEHAGEVETSLALHLFGERVRLALAEGGPPEGEESRYAAFPEGVALGPPPEGRSGAEGSPGSASAEKGKLLFERCLQPMLSFVKRELEHPA